jgi:hypothetical protein
MEGRDTKGERDFDVSYYEIPRSFASLKRIGVGM